MAQTAGDFDSSRYFRGPGDLGFYNVGTAAMRELARGIHAAHKDEWSIDDAILSRFERKIFIPLPDAEARRQILDLQLLQRGYEITMSLDELTHRTAGFSGRDDVIGRDGVLGVRQGNLV